MKELVQIGDFTGNGYDSVIKFGGWRVAYLNNTTDAPSGLDVFERHVDSDEVFILVQGACKLLLSPNGCDELDVIEMEPLVMYNVRQVAFHSVLMQPGCRILIVENIDVSGENTVYYHMTEEEKAAVLAACAE